MKEEEEKRNNLGDDDSLLFCSRDSTNQVHRSSSSRSRRSKGRTHSNKSDNAETPVPKRRSRRLHTQKDKIDRNSIESNDSVGYETVRTLFKVNSHDPKENLVNGSSTKDFVSKSSTFKRTNCWNNTKHCEKVSSSPLILKPFSNPNLVIRTRRASAIEAEEKSKSESDSELCSPKSNQTSFNKDIITHDTSTNSSIFSENS